MACEKNPLEHFMCCLSIRHKHPAIEPVVFKCGHFACYKCVKNQKKNTRLEIVNCMECKEENILPDIDCSNYKGNGMNFYSDEKLIIFKSKLNEAKMEFEGIKLYFQLIARINLHLFDCIGKLNRKSGEVDVQIEYCKDELEIRAESLKNEIDKIKDDFINKLDEIKGDFEYFIFIC